MATAVQKSPTPAPRVVIFSAASFIIAFLVLGFFKSLLLPFFVGLFLTYLLLPIVDILETRFKLSRVLSVILVIHFILGAIVLSFVIVFPVIAAQIESIAAILPQAKDFVMERALPFIRAYAIRLNVVDAAGLEQMIQDIRSGSQLSQSAADAVQQLFSTTGGIIGGVFHAFLIPVFVFFLLKDYYPFKTEIKSLVPSDLLPGATALKRDIDRTLRSVLKGQVLVSALLGIFYMGGLTVIGLNYGLAIGAIAGVCRLVPYLDMIVGLTLSLVVIITSPVFVGWGLAVGVVVVFVLAQTIDGMFITPRIIGERVGIHPSIVIVSLFGFADWLGFWGVIIAIPAVAVVKVLITSVVHVYKDSAFFRNYS